MVTDPCDECNEHQTCDALPGGCTCLKGYTGENCTECDAAAGFVERPSNPGTCILDPCVNVACDEDRVCSIDDDGSAKCACLEGRGGAECNQLWQTFTRPPVVIDAAFDSSGNGWFLTDAGLLFWDINHTPDDISDDALKIVSQELDGFKAIAVGPDDRKWLITDERILMIDIDGTWHDYFVTLTFGAPLLRFNVDAQNRLWVALRDSFGIRVLEDSTSIEQPNPPFISLFEGEQISDLAVDGNGVWLVTDTGVSYVSLGDSLSSPDDDRRIDFPQVEGLDETQAHTLVVAPDGALWFNTETGIVELSDGGDPFDVTRQVWTMRTRDTGGTRFRTGAVTRVDRDGAAWLKTPWGSLLRSAVTASGDDVATDYNPAAAPGWNKLLDTYGFKDIALDNLGNKWLVAPYTFYLFDDRNTPLDPSDDRWIYIDFPIDGYYVGNIHADPHGGLWIVAVEEGPGNGFSCSERLLYFDLGDIENTFDDVFEDYTDVEGASACYDVFSRDARGNMWFGYTYRYSRIFSALIDGGTLLDQTDDVWVRYEFSDFDPPPDPYPLFGFDPQGGLWFGTGYLDYGDSLEDVADDVWTTISPYSLYALAVDSAGNRWFGSRYDGTHSVLRYLLDGGTLTDITDDIWVTFSEDDGLPLSSISELQIDGHDEKWLRGLAPDSDLHLCSLNDNGTPEDKFDDIWTKYTTDDGLADADVSGFVTDHNSDVWIATPGGLNYLHVERP